MNRHQATPVLGGQGAQSVNRISPAIFRSYLSNHLWRECGFPQLRAKVKSATIYHFLNVLLLGALDNMARIDTKSCVARMKSLGHGPVTIGQKESNPMGLVVFRFKCNSTVTVVSPNAKWPQKAIIGLVVVDGVSQPIKNWGSIDSRHRRSRKRWCRAGSLWKAVTRLLSLSKISAFGTFFTCMFQIPELVSK